MFLRSLSMYYYFDIIRQEYRWQLFYIYLIGKNLVGKKWPNFDQVTKFIADQNLFPTNFFADQIFFPTKYFYQFIPFNEPYFNKIFKERTNVLKFLSISQTFWSNLITIKDCSYRGLPLTHYNNLLKILLRF